MAKSLTLKLDTSQLNSVVKNHMDALEKKVKSLEAMLARRDKTIRSLTSGMDITKARREAIRKIANRLVTELEDSMWSDCDEDDYVM